MNTELLLWAKTKKGEESLWHPLLYHMIDVAMVTGVLWDVAIEDPLKAKIADAACLDQQETRRWVSFFAGIHDIGKATPGFQAKSAEGIEKLKKAGFIFSRIRSNIPHHGVLSAKIITALLQESGIKAELARIIAKVVAGHHGRFPKANEYFNIGKLHLGDLQWEKIRSELYKQYCAATGISKKLRKPDNKLFIDSSALLSIAGLTSVADWIGSMEEYFPFTPKTMHVDAYVKIANDQAVQAVKSIRWQKWNTNKPTDFSKLFDFEPNEVQRKVIELSHDLEPPSLIIIETPMGSGKTEAALWLRDTLSNHGHFGSYIALPTEATSNQMFERVSGYLEGRYPHERVNLHLLHGHAAFSEDYKKLRINTIYDDRKGDSMGAVVAEEWFTPKKRALLAPFAVGTIDQALLGVLNIKHGFVRLFGLGGKTVIIDEVHAYDTYTSTLLDRLLEWLSAMGSSVILLSATLPAPRLRDLVNAYSKGKGQEIRNEQYPRISLVQGNQVKVENIEFEHSKKLYFKIVENNLDGLAHELLEKLDKGGCVAWICNTVDHAQKIYGIIKGVIEKEQPTDHVDLCLFHARFPYGQRQKREREVLSKYGKNSTNRPKKGFIVATQVIEQSLDLDFDLMVSDFAPVDLILQRAGRIHRHTNSNRPDKLELPTILLIKPTLENGLPDFEHNSYVYDYYILLRSWLFLTNSENNFIPIPEGIDTLVQQVYNFSEDIPYTKSTSIKDKLNSERESMERRMENEQREGLKRMITSPDNTDDIFESFSDDLEDDNPFVHQEFKALTRLGDSIEAVCLHSKHGNLYFDSSCTDVADTSVKPGSGSINKMMNNSLRLGHKGLIYKIRNTIDSRTWPEAWKKSPYLRNHCCLVFENNKCEVGEWVIELNKDYGLIISKGGE